MPTASEVVVLNRSAGDLVLPNGVLVPAQGAVTLDASDWAAVKAHPVVAAWGDEGRLSVVAGDIADEPAKPSRKKG